MACVDWSHVEQKKKKREEGKMDIATTCIGSRLFVSRAHSKLDNTRPPVGGTPAEELVVDVTGRRSLFLACVFAADIFGSRSANQSQNALVSGCLQSVYDLR